MIWCVQQSCRLMCIRQKRIFDDNKKFCEISYLSEEENEDYDIVHNPEKFTMYVDGEMVE